MSFPEALPEWGFLALWDQSRGCMWSYAVNTLRG